MTEKDPKEDDDLDREAESARPEEREQRQEPAGARGPSTGLNRGFLALAFSAAFCVAATVFFLPSIAAQSFLTKPMGGKWFVNPMLLIAGGLFAGLAWLVSKRLRPKLEYAKPGQGRWVRLTGYVAVAALAFYAAVTLHRVPGLRSEWYSKILWNLEIFGKSFTLRPVFFPSAAVFAILVLLWHRLANSPKWVEFQVETQAEMRKVSWPPTKEWTGSTMVVVFFMAFMAFFLFFADLGLSYLLEKLKIGI